jgi:hypothetical protein
MEKVEQYIKEHTRNCSNEIIIPTQDGCSYTKGYTSWLTPDHARSVAQIAREETIKEVCEWNEEDEMIALSIKQIVNCASFLNIVPEKLDKIDKWLESLKQRMKR